MRILEVATLSKFFDWFLLPLADRLRENGWAVDGLANGASTDGRSSSHFDHMHDATWSRHPLNFKGILPMLRRLDQVVERGRYDIVHVHTPVAAFYTRLALRRQRKRRGLKVVYTAHGFHFHRDGKLVKNALFLAAEWIAGRWTDALIVINRDDEQAARRYRIVPPGRLHYMSGIGVDTTRYAANAIPEEAVAGLRGDLGVTAETPLVLCIAELIPRKRHADLLRAFSAVRCQHAHLLIAGDGPLMSELELLAGSLGIDRRVHFLGHRPDIPVLIKASEVVVLVSEQEGLPRCLLEALCMETPVVATAIRGSQDLVAQDGVLVPVGDCKKIGAGIEWVLKNRQVARSRAARARKRMIETYDQAIVLSQYERIFAELLDSAAETASG